MALLVRTWNLFHGNAQPPRRGSFLREMVELASADRPDVLCLQELPVWALPFVDDWSGMRSFGVVTRPPLWLGPVAKWVTLAHQGLFRSGLAGQANAVLVSHTHEADDLGHERISGHGRERRLVQAVRVADRVVVANLHASNEFDLPAVPFTEIERARAFAEALARPGEPVVLAGDFNHPAPLLPGYSAPGAGIDHVLVRGARSSPELAWPPEGRVQNGVVLSDHPPVEVTIE